MTKETWFENLFEESYTLLYRIGRVFQGMPSGRGDVIEDLIQETFILAWKHRSKLMAHPNPTGWLVETFRRCMMAQSRKAKKESIRQAFSMDQDELPPMEDRVAVPIEKLVQGKEQIVMIHNLLGDKNAIIFLRYCLQGESAKKLAVEYQMSESGIRVRVSRLKKKLLANRAMFLCIAALFAHGLIIGG